MIPAAGHVPVTSPVAIAPETFLIPNLAPDGVTFVPVNSLLIRGAEPIVVDTGAPVHRQHWLEQVFGLVDPDDIRWVFLSHEDADHTGSLDEVLISAPNATLVTNAFGAERLALERSVPLHRSIWREPDETFVAGDRRLRLILPPILDGPATRGLFDERTGVLWAVDAFGALTTGAVDAVQALQPSTVASAHGPILTGAAIHDAFDRVRALAGRERVVPPGQSALDELLARTT